MTVKQLREEVQTWKTRANNEKAKVENLFADFRDMQDKFNAADKLANRYHVERDILQKQLENQKPITIEPEDYQQLKKTRVQLQNKIEVLQKELQKKQVEIVTPSDYESTKKELAKLQKEQAKLVLRMNVFYNLDTIATLINDVLNSQSDDSSVEQYAKAKPERFSIMCSNFSDFLDFYGRKG